jgi:hypothetical protein
MRSKQEMPKIIAGFAESGMTRGEYCAKHNIGIATLDYWRRVERKSRPKLVEPRWTSENRPYVDTSKPANGAEPEQEYLYPAGGCLGKHFFGKGRQRIYTDLTWAEDMATPDATRAPTQRPEWLGAASAAPQA